MRLPLPLELTKPVRLAADLDTQLRDSLGVGKYDPKTQMSWGGGYHTNSQCVNYGFIQVDDVLQDFEIEL